MLKIVTKIITKRIMMIIVEISLKTNILLNCFKEIDIKIGEEL